MIPLPAALAPPVPFPLIVMQSSAPEFVAPGIARADYRLMTTAGPLVVHVVSIDPHDPTVHLATVVAHDRMISSGETVSSMAQRTGAVAGVNADYFDISNTNQPLNVVVRDGMLLRTPSKRVAFDVARDGTASIGYTTFAGTAAYGAQSIPLTGVNEWPPEGGASLVTAAFGTLPASPGVLEAALVPLSGPPGLPGDYRVSAVSSVAPGPVTGVVLGLGPAAQRLAPPPYPGDTVTLAFDTTPPAATLAAAVGGGPLLVARGVAAGDPYSPAPEETLVRFPVAGAGVEPDGGVLFVVVDGRRPALSVGLTRPEFAALMRGLGARDAMAFDSGGSATLVARVLGDAEPSVLNDPSDGRERPVADGVFAYSDAPVGQHPHLVVRPASFVAFPGASVALSGAVVDDAGHRLDAAAVPPVVADPGLGNHVVTVRAPNGALSVAVPYRTVDRVATLRIVPDRPNPPRGVRITLTATATDERGDPIQLGATAIRWTAHGLTSATSRFVYGTDAGDALVTAELGGAVASTPVRVGDHTVNVPVADTQLAYDFSAGARAAYANVPLELPGDPASFGLDVSGDGSGVGLRAAFLNRFGERTALTLAKSVDWFGWRHVSVRLPPDLNPPVRLLSIYAVPSLGGPPVHSAGALEFRALSVVIPGSG